MVVVVRTNEGDIQTYDDARASVTLVGRLLVYRPALGGSLVADYASIHWEKLEVTK